MGTLNPPNTGLFFRQFNLATNFSNYEWPIQRQRLMNEHEQGALRPIHT